jgi:hypothetical protein
MPRFWAARHHRRRFVFGPVMVTSGLSVLTMIAAVVPGGWVLTWLLLGLTAGYALSGSA